MQQIYIGEILNTFGIKGEVKVRILTEFPEERFKKGKIISVLFEEQLIPLKIESMRFHQTYILLSFDGYQDINLVEKYKGCLLSIDRERIPALKEGYYHFELVGLDVYHNDSKIGVVTKVDKMVAQSILRVQTETKEVMIPYVDAFVKRVDLKEKRIEIEVIEGLL